jgi:uncharacterized protein YaaR (DUF327 family)
MDIQEFYKDKEKRDLIDTITTAKWVTESQKEEMIGILKEQDVDHMKDQLKDMENTLRDKVYKDEWSRSDDEAKALQDRIDKKKADIRDKESRTTHGAGHKSPGQTTYRGG